MFPVAINAQFRIFGRHWVKSLIWPSRLSFSHKAAMGVVGPSNNPRPDTSPQSSWEISPMVISWFVLWQLA